MSNNVAEQLATLYRALEEGGWERLNGNTWGRKARHGRWELRTAYVHQEATLKLSRVDLKSHRGAKPTPNREYRGAKPLSWAGNIPGIYLEKVLDKPADTP